MKNIGAYVIHLERAVERRDQIEKIRAAIPLSLEIVPAVDGLKVPAEEFRARYQRNLFKPYYPFDLRAGEIGCFLSHRKCWEMIVASDFEGALILEDDAELDAKQFQHLLPFVLAHCSSEDYVRFPIRAQQEHGILIAERDDFKLIWPKTPGAVTVGQYVGRDAAQKLLSLTQKFDRPIDGFLQLAYAHKVRILSAQPSVIMDNSTDLGGSLIQVKGVPLAVRLHREFARPLYRWRLNRINNR